MCNSTPINLHYNSCLTFYPYAPVNRLLPNWNYLLSKTFPSPHRHDGTGKNTTALTDDEVQGEIWNKAAYSGTTPVWAARLLELNHPVPSQHRHLPHQLDCTNVLCARGGENYL